MSGDSIVLEETSVDWLRKPPLIKKYRVRYRYISHSARRRRRLVELRQLLVAAVWPRLSTTRGAVVKMAHAADNLSHLSTTTTFTIIADTQSSLMQEASLTRLYILEALDGNYMRSPRGLVWRWPKNLLADEMERAIAETT